MSRITGFVNVPGDFGGLILYLGFWGLDEGKSEKTKKEEKVHCLRGANPVLPQGEGPPRGNSRDFFWTFWDVMGNPMNGTENNDKTKNGLFSRDRFIFFWVILEV